MSLATYVQLQACIATILAIQLDVSKDAALVFIMDDYRETFQQDRS